MQISKRVKIACISALGVGIALSLIVMIDKLDFVARWLGHLEAYKDNIERVIYACLFLLIVSNVMNKIRGGTVWGKIKGLKANAGIFGFEVEFSNEVVDSNHCEEVEPQRNNVGEKPLPQYQAICLASAMERKIISILSTELQLTFATNTILTRGGCRYMPDGFAVRNGRAYIVEVKAVDRSDAINRAIAQLKTFANMVQDTKISHVTVILCVVSDRPAEYFASMTRKIDLGAEAEFIFRVFSPKLLEKMNQVPSPAPL